MFPVKKSLKMNFFNAQTDVMSLLKYTQTHTKRKTFTPFKWVFKFCQPCHTEHFSPPFHFQRSKVKVTFQSIFTEWNVYFVCPCLSDCLVYVLAKLYSQLSKCNKETIDNVTLILFDKKYIILTLQANLHLVQFTERDNLLKNQLES